MVVACGGSSSGNDVDAPTGGGDDAPSSIDAATDSPPAPATIAISGTVTQQTLGGPQAVNAAAVGAFANSDKMTAVTTATSDAQGNYTLTVTTNGVALDGFLKVTKSGLVDTYVYPVDPIAMDLAGVPANMVATNNFDLLFNLTGETRQAGKGTIAVVVLDGPIPTGMPVAGAVVTSNPAGSSVHYNGGNGLPSGNATSTAADGVAYIFNVTPNVATTVSATKTGSTFRTHGLESWPDALTTTPITP